MTVAMASDRAIGKPVSRKTNSSGKMIVPGCGEFAATYIATTSPTKSSGIQSLPSMRGATGAGGGGACVTKTGGIQGLGSIAQVPGWAASSSAVEASGGISASMVSRNISGG